VRKATEDFEKPIAEIEDQIEQLSALPPTEEVTKKLEGLKKKLLKVCQEVYSKLTPWERYLVARHQERPYILDFVRFLSEDFVEIHGDRRFSDDHAIVGGITSYKGEPIIVVGHEKGKDTRQKIYRNFGMAQPEGYRKAIRIMKLAEKFHRPIITFIDTSGAYPGIGAEERGQAEAIAFNLREMSRLQVPIIVVVTGEGGSGGALGIGIGDRILMLEYAVYSVISPEGCAAILWKNQEKKKEAAENLKVSAHDLKKFNLIDEIVPEPLGGAHRDAAEAARILDGYLYRNLQELKKIPIDDLLKQRYEKFRRMGVFEEGI